MMQTMPWIVNAQTVSFLDKDSEDYKFPNAVGVESDQYQVKRGLITTEQAPSCLNLYNQVKTKFNNWSRTKNRNLK